MRTQGLRRIVQRAGYDLVRLAPPPPDIPDGFAYSPLFRPWLVDRDFACVSEDVARWTLVSPDRLHVLYSLANQALHLDGEVWECGVYRGGTALMLARIIAAAPRPLRLFDTFAGMPETDPVHDRHRRGDFSETGLEAVRGRVNAPCASFHAGLIPGTFANLEGSRIALAHLDVDIYSSYRDCLEFVYPRLVPGGFIVCDDYGFPSCPGARRAIDEFFLLRPERVLALPTGQAVIHKLPELQT